MQSYSNSCICNSEVYWYTNSFKSALQEANRLLVEYHEAKSKGIDLANVDTDKKEAENTGTKVKQAFCEKYDKYYSTNVCIFL